MEIVKKIVLLLIAAIGSNNLLFSIPNTIEWSTYFGGNGFDITKTIFTSKDNHIYVAGFAYSNDLPTSNQSYQKNNKGECNCFISKYDQNGDLIWCTYYGGTGIDMIAGMVEDNNKNIWIVGEARSESGFPVSNDAFQKAYQGSLADCFLAKFDENGNLLYSSYFGGNGYEAFAAICVDSNNNIWLNGRTTSSNFPITNDAKQKSLLGSYDAIIVKFSNDGKLLYSSYLGGDTDDFGFDIVASKDKIMLCGFTSSYNFPVSSNSYQNYKNNYYDGFIYIIDYNANVIYSSYFGGNSNDLFYKNSFDSVGNVVIYGYSMSNDLPTNSSVFQKNLKGNIDAIVTKFEYDNLNNSYDFSWVTYFGGNGDEGYNRDYYQSAGLFIDYSDNNNIYFAGQTTSNDLPTTVNCYQNVLHGTSDSFFGMLDSSGKLLYSTYLGGNINDEITSMYAANTEYVLLTGFTSSTNFPVKNAYQTNNKGDWDGFATKLSYKKDLIKVVQNVNECYDKVTYTFEVIDCPYTLNILQDDNCKIIQNLSNKKLVVEISINNHSFDAAYKLQLLTDSNITKTVEGTIKSTYLKIVGVNIDSTINFPITKEGSVSCLPVTITNISNKDIQFTNVKLSENVYFSIPPSQIPLTIKANKSAILTLCYSPTIYNSLPDYDTLKLKNDCYNISLNLLGISNKRDSIKVSKNENICNDTIVYIFEVINCPYTVNIVNKTNCNISSKLSEKKLFIMIALENHLNPATYKVEVYTDSIGSKTVEGTIASSFLTIKGIDSDNILNYGQHPIGTITCLPVTITNNANSILQIDVLYLTQNIYFSIPQSQLPLIIKPYDSKVLEVCYAPLIYENKADLDTLILNSDCFRSSIILKGNSDYKEYYAESNCNVGLKLYSKEIADGLLDLSISPNPISDVAFINFINPKEDNISISIYNIFGCKVKELTNKVFPSGYNSLNLSTDGLSNGSYYVIVNKNNLTYHYFIIITK